MDYDGLLGTMAYMQLAYSRNRIIIFMMLCTSIDFASFCDAVARSLRFHTNALCILTIG